MWELNPLENINPNTPVGQSGQKCKIAQVANIRDSRWGCCIININLEKWARNFEVAPAV